MNKKMELNDTYIMKWNDKLSLSNISSVNSIGLPNNNVTNSYSLNFWISPRPSHGLSCDLMFYKKGFREGDLVIPFIEYSFSFSIASNRIDDFNRIFDLLKKMDYTNKVNGEHPLIFDDSIVVDKNQFNHKILKKEYTKFTYNFKGSLPSIMLYCYIIENSIEFFSLIWGYNADGSEVKILKYEIGDIISLKDDKSVDYMVIDYDYDKFCDKYSIKYKITEINSINTSVIKYGKTIIADVDKITWSRNNRIDNILN